MKPLIITKEQTLKMHRRSLREEAIRSGLNRAPLSTTHLDRKRESSKKYCRTFKF